jgi:hypothetical protein
MTYTCFPLIWYQAGDDSIGEGNVHGTILNAITPENVKVVTLNCVVHISPCDNKSASHWIMFDYFFHV